MSWPVLGPTMSSVQHHVKDGVSLHPCPPAALEALGGVRAGAGVKGSRNKAPVVSGWHSVIASSPCGHQRVGQGKAAALGVLTTWTTCLCMTSSGG